MKIIDSENKTNNQSIATVPTLFSYFCIEKKNKKKLFDNVVFIGNHGILWKLMN